MQAHTDLYRFSGIRSSDRANHEHKVLAKLAGLAVGYEQCNVVNTASFLVRMQRRMLIDAAYHGRP
eukprot:2961191-Karenia_brevis.AAC.1